MDVQKYFNEGPVVWYAVPNGVDGFEITDRFTVGSIPFYTETYETAHERPNIVGEVSELLTKHADSWNKGMIELIFLKVLLSRRLKRHDYLMKQVVIKLREAFRRWPDSKVLKDGMRMLNIDQPTIVGGILRPV